MIKVTRITKDNRHSFLPAVETLSLAVCDIMLGAYDEETDTACGILSAESVNNEQTGYSIAIRGIYVDEDWRREGIGTVLVNALMDIAVDAGARALLCTHLEAEGETEEVTPFLEAMKFKRTQDALPVYAFRLSEITAGRSHDDISCSPVKGIGARQWRELVKFAYEQATVVNVTNYYDADISFLAYDKDAGLKGALLCSCHDGALYVDRAMTAEQDETAILDSLLYHSVTEAAKKYSPGTEIGITLSDPEEEMLLKELTGNKAEKVGSFVAHVLS